MDNINPSECKGYYRATSNKMELVHWPLAGGLLHLVQQEGDWAGPQPVQRPSPLLTVPNVTVHSPSTVNVPITLFSAFLMYPLKG